MPIGHCLKVMGLFCLAALGLAGCVPSPAAQRPKRPTTSQPAPRPVTPRPQPNPIPIPTSQTPPAQFTLAAPVVMAQSIRGLWASYPDRAGIAVARADGSWMISQRGDEYMPQQSVSKLWVAIAVMQALDQGRLSLDERITVRDTDLTLFHQPIEDQIGPDGFETSIGELLRAAMTMSDNTANDVLMRRVGGPSAIRDMLAAKGLYGIRFGPGEILLQSGTAGLEWRPEYRFKNNFEKARALLPYETRKAALDRYLADPVDGATPTGIARALLKLYRGELLSQASTRHLVALMMISETGKKRVKAGVPVGWFYGHKTGTGQALLARATGYNDVGLMIAPDGTAYAVVVMIAETTKPIPDRQALMQGISATIGANHVR